MFVSFPARRNTLVSCSKKPNSLFKGSKSITKLFNIIFRYPSPKMKVPESNLKLFRNRQTSQVRVLKSIIIEPYSRGFPSRL